MKKNQTLYLLLLSYYSVRYILRSVEHELLRYIQLHLNKLNITHVMYVSFTTLAQIGNEGGLFLLIL